MLFNQVIVNVLESRNLNVIKGYVLELYRLAEISHLLMLRLVQRRLLFLFAAEPSKCNANVLHVAANSLVQGFGSLHGQYPKDSLNFSCIV
jgi:hypothetical protein